MRIALGSVTSRCRIPLRFGCAFSHCWMKVETLVCRLPSFRAWLALSLTFPTTVRYAALSLHHSAASILSCVVYYSQLLRFFCRGVVYHSQIVVLPQFLSCGVYYAQIVSFVVCSVLCSEDCCAVCRFTPILLLSIVLLNLGRVDARTPVHLR